MASPLPMPPRAVGERPVTRRLPRWALESLVGLLIAALSFGYGRYSDLNAANEERLAKALGDAPTKWQARQSERLTEVETDNRATKAQVAALAATLARVMETFGADNRKLSESIVGLTVELAGVRSDLKELKGRVGR